MKSNQARYFVVAEWPHDMGSLDTEMIGFETKAEAEDHYKWRKEEQEPIWLALIEGKVIKNDGFFDGPERGSLSS